MDDGAVILLGTVEDLIANAKGSREIRRPVDILRLARTKAGIARATLIAALLPQLHRHARHLVPGLLQQHGGNRGVNASGKTHSNLHRFPQCGESPRRFQLIVSPMAAMRRSRHPRQSVEFSLRHGFPA